ncbi:hypothetical protein KR032_009704, partial [Drosophila birchii]
MSWSSGLNRTSLLPRLKPWQRFDWRACIQAQIYRDWGTYYTRRLMGRTALAAFGRAVDVCKEPRPMSCLAKSCDGRETGVCMGDYKALFQRSRCQRVLARPDLAYADAQQAEQALAAIQRDQPLRILTADIVAAQGDALYDMKAFEMALVTIHNAELQFREKQQQGRFRMIKKKTLAVFNNTVGESLHPFLQQNARTMGEAHRQRQELIDHVPRPLWKVLRDRDECDVQSVPDRPPVWLTPLERARRRHNETQYTHTYMGHHSTVDVMLLRELRKNVNFLDPLKLQSTPYLRHLSAERYAVVRRFMVSFPPKKSDPCLKLFLIFQKMLHAQNPLYNRNYTRHLSEKERRRRREMHLFHVEYQTRRDCLRMLGEVRARRYEGDVEKLSDYVEDIMSSYIELKTHRTLPWKWEFLNDVYNILALAHLDRCALPSNVDFLEPRHRNLLYLLRPERYREMHFTFGDPNIHLGIDREERAHSRLNQKLEQLEDRLRHSRYAIERSYLLFEIARCHFKEARYDKCLAMSRKAFNEARTCRSLVWRFNSIFLMCQVHALLNSYERLKECLAKAIQLALVLRAQHLVAFIAICINVNDYDLAMRRIRLSEIYIRKSRIRSAGASGHSSVSATTISAGS